MSQKLVIIYSSGVKTESMFVKTEVRAREILATKGRTHFGSINTVQSVVWKDIKLK